MPASRRVVVLALAVSTIIACEDPFTNGAPADSPGVVVPGLSNVCLFGFGCSAWSADSKTLFIVAGNDSAGITSLMAVDPASLTFRVVGPINAESTALTATADGTAMYFEAPDPALQGGLVIKKMSLSDGSTTTVAKASNQFSFSFVVSPDGTSLAYHAPGSTFEVDTIVVLDVPSGMRRGTTIEGVNTVGTFSGDGTVLSIISYAAGAVHLWHFSTGAQDTIPAQWWGGLFDVAWSGGAFHLLYFSSYGGSTFKDTSLAGGRALTYAAEQEGNQFFWLPDRSAIWTIPVSPICGSQGCNSSRYDFVYSAATKAVSIGSANSRALLFADASPDGHWIAHAEGINALYLLRQPTP